MKLATTTLALVLIGSVGSTAPVFAGDLVIPAAWEGIWDSVTIDRDCGTTGGTPTNDVDTLCEGDPVFDAGGDPELPEFDCTGSVTDTDADFMCVGVMDLEGLPGCTATFTFSVDITRSGDTYSGMEVEMIDYSPECGGIPDQCTEGDVTATRRAEAPDCKAMPTLAVEWGQIKSGFR